MLLISDGCDGWQVGVDERGFFLRLRDPLRFLATWKVEYLQPQVSLVVQKFCRLCGEVDELNS